MALKLLKRAHLAFESATIYIPNVKVFGVGLMIGMRTV